MTLQYEWNWQVQGFSVHSMANYQTKVFISVSTHSPHMLHNYRSLLLFFIGTECLITYIF